jgi:membrane protein DedA with SNARE-associated domain
VGPRTAATVGSLTWSGVVLGATRVLAPTWPVEAAQQGVYLGLAVAACAVIAIRAGTDRQPGVAL